jgi:CDP-diacylglycerol--glycerol-3-phosphate 3-phosphatidyltransferase
VAFAAALVCLAGSQMVSYTRARAEGLGVDVKEGLMQRGERIAILALALLAASAGSATGVFEPAPVLIWTMFFVGAVSGATSLRRLAAGVRALKARAAGAARLEAVRPAPRVKGADRKIRLGI